VLGEPRLRNALLRARQPRVDDQVAQLFAVEQGELRDAHQHRRIALEVRRREEHVAAPREQQLLLVEIADAEHEDVGKPLARLLVERVGPPPAVEAEELPMDVVRGPSVLRHLLRDLRQRESELVEVGHRRHRAER
jgi:hypothetical protein